MSPSLGGGQATASSSISPTGRLFAVALDAAPHALDRARSRLIAAGQATAAATVT